MPEDSLERVNEHLRSLFSGDASSAAGITCIEAEAAEASADVAPASLLVIDEVGRLELLRNGGLTAALDILDAGPSALFAHTLIIVREELLPIALDRFEPMWGSVQVVSPDDAGRALMLGAFRL